MNLPKELTGLRALNADVEAYVDEPAADGRAADGHQVLAAALAFRDELLAAGRPVAWVSMMKRLAEERHGIPLGGVRAPLPDAGAGGLLPSLRELLSGLELTQA